MRSAHRHAESPPGPMPPSPRTVALRRGAVVAACAALVVLSAWAAASVWYFVARDEVALSLLDGQAAQRRAYEDKLVALRARLDEVTTQRMVEQEVLESRLRDLLARQAAFEVRQARVGVLEERAGPSGTIEPSQAGRAGQGQTVRTGKGDGFRLRPWETGVDVPDRRSDLDRLRSGLEHAERSLAALEAAQRGALEAVVTQALALGRRYEAAIRTVGLDPSAFDIARAGGIGGPLLPASEREPFEPLLQAAETGLERFERLHGRVSALPFGEPIRGELELSSGFGHRVDPFTRSLAMHAGLDFRAEYGAPARATGAGRVVLAESSGAYGNLVEIEHALGVTSRYAHLSSIAVSVGQEVSAGAVLGRVGSTGRSTGPHLHYETRVNGDAVDPQKFLRAGSALAPVVLASQ